MRPTDSGEPVFQSDRQAVFGVARAIIEIVRRAYAFTVIDIGQDFLAPLHEAAIRQSDDVLVVCPPTLTAALDTRYALQARKTLPNEPLTHLLRAQAAQLSGDKATARRIFEAMLGSPDTEQLGLRGLFLEAEREQEPVAARQFAERAVELNPKLGWPVEALFELQCREADWAGALETLATARRHGHIDKQVADRRRAVLLTAQAQPAEDGDPEKALSLALEAHGLAPDLVPAAGIAGRLLASRGNTPRATKIIQRTWARSPHPDLATAYAYARLGDSPRDRLDRVRQLMALAPNSIEGPIALATAAIEAKDFAAARKVLEPLHEGRLTHRICLLMARIEGEEHGDKGRVREWFARAVNAPRDPAWTADGVVSQQWAPVSPVTGQLDAFQWRVPVESLESSEGELLARKLDELVALGAPDESAAAEKIIEARAEAEETRATPKPAKPAAATATAAAATKPAARPAAASDVATKPARTAEPVTVQTVAPVARDAAPSAPVLREATVKVSQAAPVAVAVAVEKRAAATGSPTAPAPVKTAAEPVKPAEKARAPEPETVKVKPAAAPAADPAKRAGADTARPAAKEPSRLATSEPKIFVPPRAPDDPGPESEGQDDVPPAKTRTVRPAH
jgi:HemY protein